MLKSIPHDLQLGHAMTEDTYGHLSDLEIFRLSKGTPAITMFPTEYLMSIVENFLERVTSDLEMLQDKKDAPAHISRYFSHVKSAAQEILEEYDIPAGNLSPVWADSNRPEVRNQEIILRRLMPALEEKEREIHAAEINRAKSQPTTSLTLVERLILFLAVTPHGRSGPAEGLSQQAHHHQLALILGVDDDSVKKSLQKAIDWLEYQKIFSTAEKASALKSLGRIIKASNFPEDHRGIKILRERAASIELVNPVKRGHRK
jgi:hypothetical protein